MMKQTLSENEKNLLRRYLNAANNLYGIISLRKLLSIYNSQNSPVSEEAFLAFVDGLDSEQRFYDIVGEDEFYEEIEETKPLDRDLVSEYLLVDADFEMYYKVKEGQFGKPYYVPDKERFLKYEDEFYHEKTLSFISLRAFFRNQSSFTREQADEIAEDLYALANPCEGEMDTAAQIVQMRGFQFNAQTYQEFSALYTAMYNDTRLHINCGHTPNELHFMY